VASDVAELRGDLDGAFEAAGDRAIAGVEAVDPLDLLLLLLGHARQLVGHVDALDDEDLPVLLDLPDAVPDEGPSACFDATRLQRASQGAGQSADGGGDDVVERRRVVREVVG
jgi:hypothetical protein